MRPCFQMHLSGGGKFLQNATKDLSKMSGAFSWLTALPDITASVVGQTLKAARMIYICKILKVLGGKMYILCSGFAKGFLWP